jgi:hypothetical protein
MKMEFGKNDSTVEIHKKQNSYNFCTFKLLLHSSFLEQSINLGF